MAAAGAMMQVAGGTLNMFGALRQGQDEQNIAEYNAQVAEQNAGIATQQGDEQARRSLINGRKVMGAQQAGYAASGVTQDGSAQDVMRASAAQSELNALTLKNNAALRANELRNQANQDRWKGDEAKTASYYNAASALLGSGGKAVSSGAFDSAGSSGGAGMAASVGSG